jgi:hypothetical protein
VHDLNYKLHFGIPETSKKKFLIIRNYYLKNKKGLIKLLLGKVSSNLSICVALLAFPSLSSIISFESGNLT